MSDMRKFMKLLEGAGEASVEPRIRKLIQDLGARPHRLAFKTDWIRTLKEDLGKAKREHAEIERLDRQRGYNDEETPWTREMSETWLKDNLDAFFRKRIDLHGIVTEARRAEAAYQERMAARDYIEDSDVLRLLTAQKSLGTRLHTLKITNPSTWSQVLDAIDSCLFVFEHNIQDEELVFLPSTQECLSNLLPFMVFILPVITASA